jgi:hypothetical protein
MRAPPRPRAGGARPRAPVARLPQAPRTCRPRGPSPRARGLSSPPPFSHRLSPLSCPRCPPISPLRLFRCPHLRTHTHSQSQERPPPHPSHPPDRAHAPRARPAPSPARRPARRPPRAWAPAGPPPGPPHPSYVIGPPPPPRGACSRPRAPRRPGARARRPRVPRRAAPRPAPLCPPAVRALLCFGELGTPCCDCNAALGGF